MWIGRHGMNLGQWFDVCHRFFLFGYTSNMWCLTGVWFFGVVYGCVRVRAVILFCSKVIGSFDCCSHNFVSLYGWPCHGGCLVALILL